MFFIKQQIHFSSFAEKNNNNSLSNIYIFAHLVTPPPKKKKKKQNKTKDLVSPINIFKHNVTLCLQRVLLEINFLEVRVHVKALRAKVIRAADVRDDTLSLLADTAAPHPHVPVPLLG